MRAYGIERPTDLMDPALPWDLSDPVRGEVQLQRMKRDVAGDPPRTIEVLSQIARAQGLQGKLDEASRSLDEAERALPNVTELVPKLRTLLERGRLLVLRRTPMEARERFLEVWKLAMDAGETFHAIDAAQMMSVVETQKKKIDWTLRALELAEASEDARVRTWRGPLHIQLGRHFATLLQLPRALESFERALGCFQSEGASKKETMARGWMARTLRLMNRTEEALAMQQEVFAELQRNGITEGVVLEEIAECLHTLKRQEEAETYFRRAYDLLSTDEWLSNNDPARIKRMKTLGKVKQA